MISAVSMQTRVVWDCAAFVAAAAFVVLVVVFIRYKTGLMRSGGISTSEGNDSLGFPHETRGLAFDMSAPGSLLPGVRVLVGLIRRHRQENQSGRLWLFQNHAGFPISPERGSDAFRALPKTWSCHSAIPAAMRE